MICNYSYESIEMISKKFILYVVSLLNYCEFFNCFIIFLNRGTDS